MPNFGVIACVGPAAGRRTLIHTHTFSSLYSRFYKTLAIHLPFRGRVVEPENDWHSDDWCRSPDESEIKVNSFPTFRNLCLTVLDGICYSLVPANWTNIKQWPLAPNSRKWRITRANVSNASHIFPEMTFGECRRVWQVRHGILANLANFKARLFYVQKNIFLGIKRSSLSSPNSPDLPNSLNSLNLLNTCQIRRSESQKFGEFLASTRIR